MVDGQTHGTTGEVFDLADQRELSELLDKLTPQGLDVARGNLRSLRTAINHNPTAKTELCAKYRAEHAELTEADFDRLTELRDKANRCRSASMDAESYTAITTAAERGFMDSGKAADLIRREQRKVLIDSLSSANGLILHLAAEEHTLNHESAMDDAEKRRAVEAFNADAEWNDAKRRFREHYESLHSVAEKGALIERHPELAEAALGM